MKEKIYNLSQREEELLLRNSSLSSFPESSMREKVRKCIENIPEPL